MKFDLSYVPTGRDLETMAISLDAVHANGISELDSHSLFGTMQTMASNLWFTS